MRSVRSPPACLEISVMTFQEKAAIVTGAAGGMGAAIARALIREGATVTLVDLEMPAGFEAEIEAGRAVIVEGSVADPGIAETAARVSAGANGRVDFLANVAGVLWFDRDRSLADIDMLVWDEVLAINLTGAALMARAALPYMRGTGGAMVHFSSIQALRGDSKPQDAYQASKAGLIALSKSLAVQFAADGVRSNCILPGPTRSPMQGRWDANPELETATAKAVPLGRVGTVEDMAETCLFLLSDRAAYITGTELIVDGGLTALP